MSEESIVITTKQCTKCKEIKELDQFYKTKDFKDGHSYSCSTCSKESNRIWRNRPKETPLDVRICTDCKIGKSPTSFNANKTSKDGLNKFCKICAGIRMREYASLPMDPIEVHKACKQCKLVKFSSEYNKYKYGRDGLNSICKSCAKGKQLEITYNISPKQYEELLINQNYVCSICFKPETLIKNKEIVALSVDHCHSTGKIRGLLCNNCNRALGLFRDNLDILANAINYLKK